MVRTLHIGLDHFNNLILLFLIVFHNSTLIALIISNFSSPSSLDLRIGLFGLGCTRNYHGFGTNGLMLVVVLAIHRWRLVDRRRTQRRDEVGLTDRFGRLE